MMSAEALAQFGACAQPWRHPVVGEAADLDRIIHAEAAQVGIVAFPAGKTDLRRRTRAERAGVDDAEAEAVARRVEPRRRAGLANVDQRKRPDHVAVRAF